MGVECGSQAVLCEYPIRLDTYSGCSHGCKYCFARTKVDIEKVTMKNCAKQLRSFIEGKRTAVTKWCDWKIPLHWGWLSDPFQPIERKAGASLECPQGVRRDRLPGHHIDQGQAHNRGAVHLAPSQVQRRRSNLDGLLLIRQDGAGRANVRGAAFDGLETCGELPPA